MLTIILRLAHVFFAALWVGMMAFQVFFLLPALNEVGPDAGKVMAALTRKRIPIILPVFALIALVSGMWLFQRMAGGKPEALMATPMGKAFGWGGGIALLAFLIGIVMLRPAMVRSMKLAESLASALPAERASLQAELQRVRARGNVMSRVITVMLLITLSLMAVARYL